MKGSEVPGLIGIVLIGVIAAGLIYLLIQYFFANVIPLFATGSNQVISHDLAGLITIAGVAPYKIEIHYDTQSSIFYNVTIDSRIVSVWTLPAPKPATISTGISYAISQIAVGNLKTNIFNAKTFDIKKDTTVSDQSRTATYSVTKK